MCRKIHLFKFFFSLCFHPDGWHRIVGQSVVSASITMSFFFGCGVFFFFLFGILFILLCEFIFYETKRKREFLRIAQKKVGKYRIPEIFVS